jgi:hypothetical protein
MTQWVLAATLTFCGAMMMLTSCTDAIGTADNPVNPNPPYDPADELAKECIAVDPNNSDGYLFLGLAQCLKDNKKEGLDNLRKAKELGDPQADALIEKYSK